MTAEKRKIFEWNMNLLPAKFRYPYTKDDLYYIDAKFDSAYNNTITIKGKTAPYNFGLLVGKFERAKVGFYNEYRLTGELDIHMSEVREHGFRFRRRIIYKTPNFVNIFKSDGSLLQQTEVPVDYMARYFFKTTDDFAAFKLAFISKKEEWIEIK